MSFLILKTLHITCVTASYSLFFLRGIWSLHHSDRMQQRWVKIAPHIVDTVLLCSAIALAYTIGQYPFINAWLTAKVIALLLYILLGWVALNPKRTRPVRLFAWIAAQAVFGYMVLVAFNHDPFPLIQ